MEKVYERLAEKGYKVLDKLGEGSQGVVLLAEASEGHVYACKIGAAVPLEGEARVLALVRHPAFPRRIQFERVGELGILIREYLVGESLEVRLRDTDISMSEVLQWAGELGEALCTLHDLEGIWLMRDVKPENLLIDTEGHLRLLDLGCACPLGQAVGTVAGSPGYMAPEQLQAPELVCESIDIYAWACVVQKLVQHCKKGGYGLRRRLQKLLRRCLRREYVHRPSSIRIILEELRIMSTKL